MITIYYDKPKKEIMWIEIDHNGSRHLSTDIRPHPVDKNSVDVCLSCRTLIDENASKLIEDMKATKLYDTYSISDSSIMSYENGYISRLSLYNNIFGLLQN